jgi:hypothetical protein
MTWGSAGHGTYLAAWMHAVGITAIRAVTQPQLHTSAVPCVTPIPCNPPLPLPCITAPSLAPRSGPSPPPTVAFTTTVGRLRALLVPR